MYEQDVGERHQCHQSGWRTWLPRAEHVRVSASSWFHSCSGTGSHLASLANRQHWNAIVTYVIRFLSLPLNASILHFNTRNLTISRLFAVTLNSLLHDFIVQAGSIFLYCTPSPLHQWTSLGSCILFPWIGESIIEQIYQLSYGLDAFSNTSWSQLLMDLGLGWNKRQILTKKLIVNTTSKLDVDFSRLDIATDVVLKGLVSFVSSKMIVVPHLNGKLAFVEGCVHCRYSDTKMTNIFQEWNEVARVVLAIIRKCPWYYLFDAWQVQLPATRGWWTDEVRHQLAQFQAQEPNLSFNLSPSFPVHRNRAALQTSVTHSCSALARTHFCSVLTSVVGDLHISLAGELSSAIAMMFDGIFGEFTFSWCLRNRFVIPDCASKI